MEQIINKITADFTLSPTTFQHKSNPKIKWDIDIISEPIFSHQLSDFIYRQYYCEMPQKSSQNKYYKSPQLNNPNYFLYPLINQLKKSAPKFDHGWIEYEKSTDGSAYAQKGFYKTLLAPGQFIDSSTIFYELQPSILGSSRRHLSKVNPPFSYQPTDYFIYFKGETEEEYPDNFLVRYYFNSSSSNANKVLSTIIKILNTYQIPFQMKCPLDAKHFDRTDSIVLYLNKRYANYVYPILDASASTFHRLLQSDIPLFTRRLWQGIGFAESPPNNEVSFGMSRCDLISKAIFNCISTEIIKTDWTQNILSDITQKGFDLEAIHLNPFNKYPYVFN